jgi:D-amino-acid dehydrogenase
VRSAADTLESQLSEVGRRDLLQRNGHYVLWFGPGAAAGAATERARAASLGIATKDAPEELLRDAAARAASPPASGAATIAGAWFPDSAHVVDPALVARAFVTASTQAGATFLRTSVRHVHPTGDRIEIVTDTATLSVRTAVICAGAWSKPLLAPFGVHAPLEAERGYHVELPNHAPLIDAPILYADDSVVVTPMTSRLRASSFLEFAGLGAPPDPRKPAQLRAKLRRLGYECEQDGASWMGPRPTLPDYLPGIGRAHGRHDLFYAVGHQHLGLTLAAVTADLVTEIVTARTPRFDVRPFDLRRFGSP